MKIRIELFAHEAKLAGQPEVCLDLPDAARISDIRREMIHAFPAMRERMPQCRIARNCEFAADEDEIQPDDEIALIGPVSGG